MNCAKCGTDISESGKFCSNCGSPCEVEKVEEQTPEASLEVSTIEAEAREQVQAQPLEPLQEQTPVQTTEPLQGQAPMQTTEPLQGQAPVQMTAPPPASLAKSPQNKNIKIIVAAAAGVLVLLVALIVVAFSLSGRDQESQIRRQLNALDNTSLSEIVNWIENDLPEFEVDIFYVSSLDEEDNFIRDGIIEDEERFISFDFFLGELENGEFFLYIDLIYEALDMGELLREQLGALDSTSLDDILEWIEYAEETYDDLVSVWTRSINLDGDWMDSEIFDNETQFVEWEFEIDDSFFSFTSVTIYARFDSVKTVTLGDTFEQDGLLVTFGTEIVWGQVDDTWSNDHRAEYFKVPVELENISNTTNNFFFVSQFAPDGNSLDSIRVPGVDDNIVHMGEIRAGAEQSGYLYFRFVGDGDYVVELRDRPFSIEVIIPIDAYEMRGPEPTAGNIQDLADSITASIDDFDVFADGYMDLIVETSGDNEIIIIYRILDVVPEHNIPLIEEAMDEYLGGVQAFLSLMTYAAMIEYGISSLTLTTVVQDINERELFRRSLDFGI